MAVRYVAQSTLLIRSDALRTNQIVAVGLLTSRDLDVLGPTFTRVWPVEEAPCFSGLLRAIDEADRELWRADDRDASRLPEED